MSDDRLHGVIVLSVSPVLQRCFAKPSLLRVASLEQDANEALRKGREGIIVN
ncbi:hypothetical protein HM1_1677 [Heliomicrobium modesticaldum Ice1]|uniref:Uncharacterized protein n=1 Tax=Heliobacterium modesticaldum (strain ATCC 51547 / Ice1) TaxID=498761 RepID=B0TE52_HELMI|nr:hypothetical protein HM1_1677 [Heliomicrobium modesticaldum Ice1]